MPRFAMKNRKEVECSGTAGCFHCLALFEPGEVTDYTDDDMTCICPKCGVDAVIGDMGSAGELDAEKLRRAKFYWFEREKNIRTNQATDP